MLFLASPFWQLWSLTEAVALSQVTGREKFNDVAEAGFAQEAAGPHSGGQFGAQGLGPGSVWGRRSLRWVGMHSDPRPPTLAH